MPFSARMCWGFALAAIVPIVLMSAGCNLDNSVKINLPDGSEVASGKSIAVEATIREDGNAPQDNSSATFTTDVGSFEEYSSSVTDPVQDTTVNTKGGKAQVKLYSFPGAGGTGKVSASYTTIGGLNLRGEASVNVLVAKASGAKFSAACDPKNVFVFENSERPAMQIRCVVHVNDISGKPVPKAKIEYKVESGSANECTMTPVDESGNDAGTYVFAMSASCDPMDVEPITQEPNHMENGVVHNPRDGLITIVFYTQGEEGFVDANGNGTYDDGESIVGNDLPEPYVDADDNGQWDTGEWFLDTNGNGKWDAANGKLDGDTKIWASTHILFTGAPYQNAQCPACTSFNPSGITIPANGTLNLTLSLMDINHNPIAANYDSDGVTFSVTGADISGPSFAKLIHSMGMVFNDNGTIQAGSFKNDRAYQVTLSNSGAGSVKLQTNVQWTSAPSFNGFGATTQSADLIPVNGTAK